MDRTLQNSAYLRGKNWSYDVLDHEIQKDAVNCDVFIIVFYANIHRIWLHTSNIYF